MIFCGVNTQVNYFLKFSYVIDHLQPTAASNKLVVSDDPAPKKVSLNLSNTIPKSMVSALSNSAKRGRRPSRNASSSLVGSSFLFNTQYNSSMASEFLSKNGLEVLVISHTINDNGYRKIFENKSLQILSVFSASCFCGSIWNKGAISIVGSVD